MKKINITKEKVKDVESYEKEYGEGHIENHLGNIFWVTKEEAK